MSGFSCPIVLALRDDALLSNLQDMLRAAYPLFPVAAKCRNSSELVSCFPTVEAIPARHILFVDAEILLSLPHYISHIRSVGSRCYCVLVTQARRFDLLLTAMQYGAESYIYPPVTFEPC